MMLKTHFFLTFFFCFVSFVLFSQNKIDTTDQNYKAYLNDEGIIISEGYLEEGKPNRYWINYYSNGLRKSEGNRENFELDGPWIFYNENGSINTIITYKNGVKNGFKEYYENSFLVKKEFYEVNKIIGEVIEYYPDSIEKIKSSTPYKNNLKDGIAFHYAKDGRLIELVTYNKGFLKDREKVNQKDELGRKQGIWKIYYSNYRLKQERRYKDDLLNGYEKNYNRDGKLETAFLYIDGIKQNESDNEADFNIENQYYSTGEIKKKTTFNMKGKKDGVEKSYTKDGEVEASAIYKNGYLIAEGIIDDKGWYQGEWKHYYLNGNIKSEGGYTDGKRTGKWAYYFSNGKKEQIGFYDKNGKYTGEWNWYFENGNLLRSENYRNGLRDGVLEEYEADGKLITKGEYYNNLKEGAWFYELNDHSEKGNYQYGERHDNWEYFHKNGKLSFEGKFMDGVPDGKHRYYNENGVLIKEQNFEYGQKVGQWKWFDSNGIETLKILYKNDNIVRINGSKVDFLKK